MVVRAVLIIAILFSLICKDACFAGETDERSDLLSDFSGFVSIPVSYWLIKPVVDVIGYMSGAYIIPKLGKSSTDKVLGEEGLIAKTFNSVRIASTLDYIRSGGFAGAEGKAPALAITGGYIDGITAAIMAWGKLSLEKLFLENKADPRSLKTVFAQMYDNFIRKVASPLRIGLQKLFGVYLGYDPLTGPTVQKTGESLLKFTEDPSKSIDLTVVYKNESGEVEKIEKKNISYRELKMIAEFRSEGFSPDYIRLSDKNGEELSVSAALDSLEKKEGGLVVVGNERMTVKEARKAQDISESAGKGKFVKVWDESRKEFVYKPFKQALQAQARAATGFNKGAYYEDMPERRSSRPRRSSSSSGGYYSYESSGGKKDGSLLKALLVQYIFNSVNVVSFGRMGPVPTIENGKLSFVLGWRSGNDLAYLRRYGSYVEGVHKRGFVVALSDFASGSQGLSSSYSVFSRGMNSGLFGDSMNFYLQDLNNNYKGMLSNINELLVKKQDVLNAVIREMDHLSNQMIRQANSLEMREQLKNMKDVEAKIRQMSKNPDLSSKEKDIFSKVSGYYQDYWFLKDTYSRINQLRNQSSHDIDKQVEVFLTEALLDFASVINTSIGPKAKKAGMLQKDPMVKVMEEWSDKLTALRSKLGADRAAQGNLDALVGNLARGIKKTTDDKETAMKAVINYDKDAEPLDKSGSGFDDASQTAPDDHKRPAPTEEAARPGKKNPEPAVYTVVDSKELRGPRTVINESLSYDQPQANEPLISGDKPKIPAVLDRKSKEKADPQLNITAEDIKRANAAKEPRRTGGRVNVNFTDSLEHTLDSLESIRTPGSSDYGQDTEKKAWTEEEYKKFVESLREIEELSNTSK